MSTQEIPIREPSPDTQPGPGGAAVLEPDGLGPYPAPPGRRRGRRLVAGVLAVAVLGGAASSGSSSTTRIRMPPWCPGGVTWASPGLMTPGNLAAAGLGVAAGQRPAAREGGRR